MDEDVLYERAMRAKKEVKRLQEKGTFGNWSYPAELANKIIPLPLDIRIVLSKCSITKHDLIMAATNDVMEEMKNEKKWEDDRTIINCSWLMSEVTSEGFYNETYTVEIDTRRNNETGETHLFD